MPFKFSTPARTRARKSRSHRISELKKALREKKTTKGQLPTTKGRGLASDDWQRKN